MKLSVPRTLDPQSGKSIGLQPSFLLTSTHPL